MQHADNLKDYKSECESALHNAFLRKTLDNFATAYRTGRQNAFAGLDIQKLVDDVAVLKDAAAAHMDELYETFKARAESIGVHVHLAKTADEANAIIARIAKDNDCKTVIKAKSMTAEETLLNHALERQGLIVTESDLGEWIIQLRHEGPTHMVMPAIHLSRQQVAELFTKVTGSTQDTDIDRLVKVARRELRAKFVQADMGISGANFAIAKTATLGTVTNEGNLRLTTTLPRVHVALVGLEKLVPTMEDALKILRVLPRNATGQAITSYVTWITGRNLCKDEQLPDKKKIMHVVFLDNGRRALAKDPLFSQVLRCVRCGACANVCPLYRLVGGHNYGHIYIGAIGLILTYFMHGPEKAKNIVQNCINCGACGDVCAAGIDLPRLIKEVQARLFDESGHPLQNALIGKVMQNRKLFHGILRTIQKVQGPLVDGKTHFLRHLPLAFTQKQDFRALPAIAATPFRDRFPVIQPWSETPKSKAAIFTGCAHDFIYPEQAEAAVKVMGEAEARLTLPEDQTCCGLPLLMTGEKEAFRRVAIQNIEAFEKDDADHIVTMCASCASCLKHNYTKHFETDPVLSVKAQDFAAKVIDFPSYLVHVLGLTADDFTPSGETVTYHHPCHLCRGMGVVQEPLDVLRIAGYEVAELPESTVCCGFGGSYSVKFPELSKELLTNKINHAKETQAEYLATDCPGCVLQIRGGAVKQHADIQVKHLAELLVERIKKK
ncbi:L-lactate dehydrogenase (quinone) large subunit LdhH [Desulfovibrio inopinatus]|uniref:L-lactate dehydrogenase (quinone) large subunit LdhH n=1 Tax=Desulfovibrio inopinatus TaxID=102109 RepID=UPI00040606B7|nr:LUD domain-containing protein [Desulfovibrio inopinatus]